MVLKIYNTLTNSKEEFKPINPPMVLMYNCGPTVYDYFHIGNARNFVMADTIRRYLAYAGYKVKFIQNITDIDDKIINRANEQGISAQELAQKYTDIFFEQSDKLGIMRADKHPKATEYIPQMLKLISILIEKEHAYEIEGDVYFRVRSFAKYGELSGKNIDDLLEGARVEVDDRKESPLDFALWKSSKPGEPSWDSPWGKGRPGWHIECSAMSMNELGESIDIHSGGADLTFPHHENERAQSEAATGKPFVKYWIHNGFLNINNQKMSKSLGNFFTINEVLEKFSPLTVRYFLLSAHFRHPLNFSSENLQEAQSAIERIKDCIVTTEKLLETAGHTANDYKGLDDSYIAKFKEAMDDDFNTAKTLGVIFDIVAELNSLRKNGDLNEKTVNSLVSLINTIKEISSILGLDIFKKETSSENNLEDKLLDFLVELRIDLRKNKNFQLADKIRDRLKELSITIEDHPQGTIWKKP